MLKREKPKQIGEKEDLMMMRRHQWYLNEQELNRLNKSKTNGGGHDGRAPIPIKNQQK